MLRRFLRRVDKQNRLSFFDPIGANPGACISATNTCLPGRLAYAGNGWGAASYGKPYPEIPFKKGIAPRVGFAYALDEKTVVRAGYGIYYNGSIYNQLAGLLAQQPPFAVTTTQTTSTSQPLTIQTGFVSPPAATTILNTSAVDRGYRAGYGQTWIVSTPESPRIVVASAWQSQSFL